MSKLLSNIILLPGILIAAFLLTGCNDEPYNRLTWSPDGSKAAVIAEDGLHISDPSGNLSKALDVNVKGMEWLSDSNQAILWRQDTTNEWSKLASLLSPDEIATIDSESKIICDIVGRTKDLENPSEEDGDKLDKLTHLNESLFFIYTNGPNDVKERICKELKIAGEDKKQPEMVYHNILKCTLSASDISNAISIYQTHKDIAGIRVSPNGKHICLIEDLPNDSAYRLLVISDTGKETLEVSAKGNLFPDWTKDSRSLVFIEKNDQNNWHFDRGTLTKVTVCDEQGKLLSTLGEPDYLVDVAFQGISRVRCTGNGRIYFCCPQAKLPMTKTETTSPIALFCLDQDRYQTAIPLTLPQDSNYLQKYMAYFKVSPDGNKIAVLGQLGETYLLKVQTSQVQALQYSPTNDHVCMLPAFRSDNEITYVAPTKRKINNENVCSIVLFNLKDDEGKDLSQNWASKVSTGWLIPAKQ